MATSVARQENFLALENSRLQLQFCGRMPCGRAIPPSGRGAVAKQL